MTRRWAIIWSNNGIICCCICAPLGLNELTQHCQRGASVKKVVTGLAVNYFVIWYLQNIEINSDHWWLGTKLASGHLQSFCCLLCGISASWCDIFHTKDIFVVWSTHQVLMTWPQIGARPSAAIMINAPTWCQPERLVILNWNFSKTGWLWSGTEFLDVIVWKYTGVTLFSHCLPMLSVFYLVVGSASDLVPAQCQGIAFNQNWLEASF